MVAQSSIQARSAAASAACGGALCSSSRARGGAAAAGAALTPRWPAPRRAAATAHPRRRRDMRLGRISRRLRRLRGAAPAKKPAASASSSSVAARGGSGYQGGVRRASPRAEGSHGGQRAPEGGCRYTRCNGCVSFSYPPAAGGGPRLSPRRPRLRSLRRGAMARGLLLLALLCAAMPYDGAAQPPGATTTGFSSSRVAPVRLNPPQSRLHLANCIA